MRMFSGRTQPNGITIRSMATLPNSNCGHRSQLSAAVALMALVLVLPVTACGAALRPSVQSSSSPIEVVYWEPGPSPLSDGSVYSRQLTSPTGNVGQDSFLGAATGVLAVGEAPGQNAAARRVLLVNTTGQASDVSVSDMAAASWSWASANSPVAATDSSGNVYEGRTGTIFVHQTDGTTRYIALPQLPTGPATVDGITIKAVGSEGSHVAALAASSTGQVFALGDE